MVLAKAGFKRQIFNQFIIPGAEMQIPPSPILKRCVPLNQTHFSLQTIDFLTMISNSFRFATKVWLTSVIIAPFFYFIISGSFDVKKLHLEAAGLGMYTLFAIVFGLLFSLPCWTILIYVVKLINRQNISLPSKKVIVILIGSLLTYLLFFLLFFEERGDNEQLNSNMRLATAYCLTNVIGIIFYKLSPDL